jgi:hypothetical protein
MSDTKRWGRRRKCGQRAVIEMMGAWRNATQQQQHISNVCHVTLGTSDSLTTLRTLFYASLYCNQNSVLSIYCFSREWRKRSMNAGKR